LAHFKRNPVILNSHNYGDAAEVIGKAGNVRVEQRKLQGVITFAVNENPKARVIFDLYAGGFLSAFSVGFIPTEFKQNKDGTTDWWTIVKAELLEVSAVSVPANARALAKAKGIDVDALGADEEPEVAEETPTPAETEPEVPAEVEPEAEEATETTQEAPVEVVEPEPTVVPEVTPEPQVEAPVKPSEPVQASYQTKVLTALHNIDSKELQSMQKVARIINSMLNDTNTHMEAKTYDIVRRRKINQAIRILLEAK
jgi:HK97 family phage prohead protease